MKFFLVVSFLMTNYTIDRPIFLFSNPNFETHTECQKYVDVMHIKIYQKAAAAYKFQYTPEAIYCITREEVKNLFKQKTPKKTETQT